MKRLCKICLKNVIHYKCGICRDCWNLDIDDDDVKVPDSFSVDGLVTNVEAIRREESLIFGWEE